MAVVINTSKADTDVRRRFRHAKVRRKAVEERLFRVSLGWVFEPNLPWLPTRHKAWVEAQKFLEEYPDSPYTNPKDPILKNHSKRRVVDARI